MQGERLDIVKVIIIVQRENGVHTDRAKGRIEIQIGAISLHKMVHILEDVIVDIALVHRLLPFIAESARVKVLHKGEGLLLNPI